MAKRAAGRQDVYPNRALFSVTLSAADTLTFQQIRFGMGVFQGTALIVNRIDWHPDQVSMSGMVSANDMIRVALTNRDDLAALTQANMNVLVFKELMVVLDGTAANFIVLDTPFISDFSRLPGGGLIIPANPLFIGATSAGIGAAMTVHAVMYYQTKVLADADYIELVQSLIPLNI